MKEQTQVSKCKFCGQLGVDGLKLHIRRKHPEEFLARLESKKAAKKAKFLEGLGLESCETNPKPAVQDVATSCPSTLEFPVISTTGVVNATDRTFAGTDDADLNPNFTTDSGTALPAAAAAAVSAARVEIKTEPVNDNEDEALLVLDSEDQPEPMVKRRRSSTSSVDSNATLPVRYNILKEKIDPGYAKYELQDAPARDLKLFEAEQDEMKVEEKLSKFFNEPYLAETYKPEDKVTGGEFFLVHTQLIPIPEHPLVKAEQVKEEKQQRPIKIFFNKCRAPKCTFWVTSPHGKSRERLQKLIVHFREHVEQAEQRTLKGRAQKLADQIQRKLDAEAEEVT